MTTRDIQDIVGDLYGVEVSPALISEITADLDAEVTAWRTRPIDAVWPILYFDGLVTYVRGAIATLFDYPPPIRKAIYTTNAIESANSVIRKFTRNRKIYPNEDSALKLIWCLFSAVTAIKDSRPCFGVPSDGLSLGQDSGSPVGEYDRPLKFMGELSDLRIYWGALDEAAIRSWAQSR